jgi:hypothetical protein
MAEQHAGCDFVDILSARSRRADKLLVKILLSYSQRLHALQEFLLFVG